MRSSDSYLSRHTYFLPIGAIGFIGLIGWIAFIGRIGRIGLIGPMGLIGRSGLFGSLTNFQGIVFSPQNITP
jgi:hypothetical protein